MVKMLQFDDVNGPRSSYVPKFNRNRMQYCEITALVSARTSIMVDVVALRDIRSVGPFSPLVRWSVGPLVRWSVGPLVRLVRWSVGPLARAFSF
jgi:hypothetical protein